MPDSVSEVRVREASHPGLASSCRLRSGRSRVVRVTQIDVDDVEGHSAVEPTLLVSLAEDLSEAHSNTNLRDIVRIGGQLLPSSHRDADEFSSASSESCWGEGGHR